MSKVKDPSLAGQGKKNIEWAELQMGSLLKVKERFESEKPLQGITVGMALHITKETAVLVKTLVAGGAKVAITGCNPLSTQDDVAAALAEEEGVEVFGWRGESNEDYYWCLGQVIAAKPDITIDDGCDLVSEIHSKHPDMIPNIIGGCEETTTGIIRLKAMEKDNALKYPVVAVNDAKTKHLMDNIKGTGQSSLDGVLRASNIMIAGKTFVVLGYGNCGKGVAKRAQGMDANVIVTEVRPFRALQAVMDGHRVMPMMEAIKEGDIYMTLTGDKHVISLEHMKGMKDGAIICNSGHFNIEIDLESLGKQASSRRQMRPSMEEYILNGKKIFVLGQGRLVNLACAEGHPSDIMAMSFINQSLACEYLVKNKGKLKPGMHVLPEETDEEVAQLQLDAMGIKIDKLTPEQEAYLASWQEGT